MKFVFLLSGLKAAGLENYLLRFLSFCHGLNKDYQFTIICRGSSTDFSGTLHEKFLNLGVELVHVPMKHSSLIGYFSLYKIFKDSQYHGVIDFSGYLAGPTMFVAWIANIKVRIASYRESRYQFKMNVIKRFFVMLSKRFVIAFSTRILSNSKAAFDFFHEGYAVSSKFKVIKNAINKPTEVDFSQRNEFLAKYHIPEDVFVVGHVGRFIPAKNHNNICEVIKAINQIDPSIYFLLCGNDVCRGMNTLSNSLTNVAYIDYLSDMSVFYNCLDLFYFPSTNEGQPNALLEAMSANVPIVASNISSVVDSVPSEAYPFLVDPYNYDYSVNKILKLRESLSLYPIDIISKQTRDIYSSEKNFYLFLNEICGD